MADLGLMVAGEHRRQGIGTALLEAAEAWARTVGVRKLELHVFPHNEAAIAPLRGPRLSSARATAAATTGAADGFVDAILMAKT